MQYAPDDNQLQRTLRIAATLATDVALGPTAVSTHQTARFGSWMIDYQ
jgi:hypothetical protein